MTRVQPTDWRTLVEAAKIGEMCTPETSVTEGAVAGLNIQLSVVQEQLKQLMNQRTTSSAGSRSPSPRRVRFEDEDDRRDRRSDQTRSDKCQDSPFQKIVMVMTEGAIAPEVHLV